MNKSGSSSDFMRTLFIGAVLFLGLQFILGRLNNNQPPPRTAPALAKAFEGIDPAMGGTPLDATTGLAEVKKMDAQIKTNEGDELAQWSRLRSALIQQYILGTLQSSKRRSGFLGFGGEQTYYPAYDAIVQANKGDAVEAQAIYQEGDLLWRQSLQNKVPQADASAVLESLVHKGRGNAAFSEFQIYVPKITDPAQVSLDKVPDGGFKLVPVKSLRGTIDSPNPQGVLDRVNQYYSTSVFYKVFDGAVKALGSNPAYSYGLAILLFAIFTRTAMQPIYKKQYESMKGMAAIQPEMKKIQEKYKGKTDQAAQMAQMKEMQELNRRHGVNPMLGCGLALIQMPIFFVLVYPMIQHYEPKMELVGASFLWIHALSRPDIPLLIMYAASMFLSFRLSSTPPTDDMQRQQQMMMSFIFPFVFPFFMSTYPAAFIMYWMTYNALGTFFQWRLVKAADPSKNFWLTLRGDGLFPKTQPADAVAPRPVELNKEKTNGNAKPKSVKIQSKTPSLNGTLNGQSAALNGGNGSNGENRSNGVHHSAPEGAVLEPSADEVEKRKKKKK